MQLQFELEFKFRAKIVREVTNELERGGGEDDDQVFLINATIFLHEDVNYCFLQTSLNQNNSSL
jgi:hypothetical protein